MGPSVQHTAPALPCPGPIKSHARPHPGSYGYLTDGIQLTSNAHISSSHLNGGARRYSAAGVQRPVRWVSPGTALSLLLSAGPAGRDGTSHTSLTLRPHTAQQLATPPSTTHSYRTFSTHLIHPPHPHHSSHSGHSRTLDWPIPPLTTATPPPCVRWWPMQVCLHCPFSPQLPSGTPWCSVWSGAGCPAGCRHVGEHGGGGSPTPTAAAY